MNRAMKKDPTLSEREWQAVSAAFADASECGCGNLEKPRLASGLLRAVTGSRARRPLADHRLEAVRTFVCATNRQRRTADHLVPALLDHGFNDRQVDALAMLAF